jgi:hypothetical protein
VRRESTWVYCFYPRLGSGQARSCPLSGRSFGLYCALRRLQLVLMRLPAEFRSLGGTPNYGPRHLATASSTSGSITTWPHESLCSASSVAAAAWTRSRAAAPRCPSQTGGPHGHHQCRRLLGCSGHRIRQRCRHTVQLIIT